MRRGPRFDADGRLLSTIGRGALAAVRPAVDGHRVVAARARDRGDRDAGRVADLERVAAAADAALLARGDPCGRCRAARVRRRPALSSSGAVSVAIVAKQNLTAWLDAAADRRRDSARRLFGCRRRAGHARHSDSDARRRNTVRPQAGPTAVRSRGVRRRADARPACAATAKKWPTSSTSSSTPTRPAGARFKPSLRGCKSASSSADVKLMSDGMFPHLAANLAVNPGTNLLQGQYAPKSNWAALARPWRLAASLLLALGVLALVAQGVQYLSLRRDDAQLTEQIASGVRADRGGEVESMACENVVQQRLRDVGGSRSSSGETFLSTLAAIAESRDGESRIEALSYRNDVMDLQVIAPGVPALDAFRRGLGETQRFEAVIESANPTDDGVEGRIKIASVRR